MSEKLSRRDLVAVLGAGMAASACSDQKPPTDPEGNDPEERSCDNKGKDPHEVKPYGWYASNYPDKFSCKHIAILCVGLAKNWEVSINHANFNLDKIDNDENDRLIKAVNAIDETWITGKKLTFSSNHMHPPRNRDKDGSVDDHDDFGMFKFKSPIELFVYIYDADDGDNTNDKRVYLSEDRLISFGSYLQEKNRKDGKKAFGNCSYFHARAVKSSDPIVAGAKLFHRGELIRVENWSRDIDGNAIKNKEILHSMNIHFLVSDVGRHFTIPMVFDPDTGNGTGNEP